MMRILRMNLAGLALLGPALFWALHAQTPLPFISVIPQTLPVQCSPGNVFVDPDPGYLDVCVGSAGQSTGPGTLKRLAFGTWINGETPAGVIDGTNTIFALSQTMVQSIGGVYVDGLRIPASGFVWGGGTNANTITLSVAPKVSVVVDYLTP